MLAYLVNYYVFLWDKMKQINEYLEKLKKTPDSMEFNELMELIDSLYIFTPTEFSNGDLVNQAEQNQGSCKLFSFAKLHNLNQQQTLASFGAFYRQDVLENPDADNHQNIRNFIQYGWDGIKFSGNALSAR